MSEPRGFAWVLNLDAELELANVSHQASSRLSEQLQRFGADSQRLLGPRDVLLPTGSPILETPGAWLGRAWCPTPRALARLAAAGVTPEAHPTLEVLQRVNHRRFAFELGGGLPTQAYCGSLAELEAHLDYVAGPWLLKRPFGFAGRGQLRVYRELDAVQRNWVDASLRVDGLIIEPLIEPQLEVSAHGFIDTQARVEFGFPCVQTVSDRGVFRGIRRAAAGELSERELTLLRQTQERAAAALIHAGYFGPFGVDAYRYRSERLSGFCALSEINARYSMGFVTGFPRHPSTLRV